jgi:hypothetical protein
LESRVVLRKAPARLYWSQISRATLLHPDGWVANGIKPPKSSVTPNCGGSRDVPRVKLPRPPPIASSDPLYRNGEYISDAALGLDDARRARIALELTPQAENLHIDAAVEDIFVNAGRLQ